MTGTMGDCPAADELAKKRWRVMGARTQAEARGFFAHVLTERLGLVIVREMARHRLSRVHYVGMSRAVVEARTRAAAQRPPPS